MATRPIIYEISVVGADGASREMQQLAAAERATASAADDASAKTRSLEASISQLESGSSDASRETDRARQNLERYSRALETAGRAMHEFGRALQSSHPDTARFLDFTSQLTANLGQNIQRFGAWGGAITTALQASEGPLIAAIERWSNFHSLVQETEAALGVNLGQTGAGSLDPNQAGRVARQNRERARLAALPEGVDPESVLSEGDLTAQAEFQRRDAERRRRAALRRFGLGSGAGGSFDGQADAEDRARAVEEEIKARRAATAEAEVEINRQQAQQETEAWEQAHQIQVDLQEQLNEIQEQTHQNELRRIQEQVRARQEMLQQIQSVTQPLTSMFVGAISKVIAGSESAEDAFKGLLSQFLEFISQQAALKAAFEYAEAAASFASLNVPMGLAHLGAGIAFTGVAILAGAGAVASAPSSAGAPASTPANQPQQGGPSNYTIIWNSPVVTAQDNAELGRNLTQTIRQSNQRFASSV